jgi:Fe-S cluster assembly protein SufD
MEKIIILKQNQELFLPIIWKGAEETINLNVQLQGDGSSVRILGLLIGKKQDRVDIKISVAHVGQNTKSEIFFKGALEDESGVNFEGLVKINKNAKKTNAWLAVHLLLLSDKASGRAIPSLEILENDIKAGHATTVGKVNDLEMFYLQSRGLSKEKAKRLIVEGFLKSVMDQMPKELMNEKL